jgi:universal stress protein A
VIKFERILCPLDFAHDSLSALDVALMMAEKHAAMLYLLHVARIPTPDMDAPMPIGPNPHWELSARKRLTTVALERVEGKAPWRVEVRGGIPDDMILEVIQNLGIDLVVMTTHGRTGIAHFLLGSVTESVVRKAPCPVMAVKP